MRKGVTLIEVLVASLILVITVGAILISYAPRKQIIQVNKDRVIAISIIERVFERIRRQSTKSAVENFLYNKDDSGNNVAISSTNPATINSHGKTFKLYYTVYGASSLPYTIVSMDRDNSEYLKEDKNDSGVPQYYGAKVLEIEANIEWQDDKNNTQKVSMKYRGLDEL